MADEPSSSGAKRSCADAQDAPHRKRANIDDSNIPSDPEEAITKEEIQGTEQPPLPPSPLKEKPIPRSAFSELMAPKPKPEQKLHHPSRTARDGLGAYLANPSSFPSSRVIFHTPTAVAIHDMFPKATVHCLLLPRSAVHNRLHPFEAFRDAAFLAQVRADTAVLRDLVAKELQRVLGRHSAAERARNAVLDGEVEPEVGGDGDVRLPEGRNWLREVKVGVHAVPSMNHLHVHVLSRDMHSERMKHRKHYNSFTTDFFVPLDDFPLAEDDARRRQDKWPERPIVCWRCGKDFGNKFKELKQHLEVEFEQWKRE